MTPEAALVYASETRGILQAMSFLLVVACIAVLWIGGAWVVLKIRVRGWKKHEAALREKVHSLAAERSTASAARDAATAARDLALLRVEELKTTIGDVEWLKGEVTRVTRIREKTEARLTEQNVELEQLRGRVGFLQRIVDHVDT